MAKDTKTSTKSGTKSPRTKKGTKKTGGKKRAKVTEKPVVEEKDDTDIIVTYLSRIDDNYINHNFKDSENNMYICKECNNENILYKQHESEI